MKSSSQESTLAAWDQVLAALAAHQKDLANCEPYGADLAAAASNLRDLQSRRDRLRAEAQQATAEVQAVIEQGNDLLLRVRAGVKSRYGIHDDRLREFGIKPTTGRRKSKPRACIGRAQT